MLQELALEKITLLSISCYIDRSLAFVICSDDIIRKSDNLMQIPEFLMNSSESILKIS